MIYTEIKDGLNLDLINTSTYEELSTKKIEVKELYLGVDEKRAFYDKMVGIIEYNHKVYRFIYNISDCYMECIEEVVKVKEDFRGIELESLDFRETDFGSKAFWENTPISYLRQIGDDRDTELRRLMNKLKTYVIRHKLRR